jgi:hypothetical protein
MVELFGKHRHADGSALANVCSNCSNSYTDGGAECCYDTDADGGADVDADCCADGGADELRGV